MNYELVVGDKSFSSWSLRPWLLMKMADIPFVEHNIRLRQEHTGEEILKYSPSGKVPLLIADGTHIWDSLAICEFIAERHPEKALWPVDQFVRAHARSIVSEMHAGFMDLRRELDMKLLERITPELGDGGRRDIARVQEIWRDCRAQAQGGPFLFGEFTIADAFYAPVVTRFVTYGIELDPVSKAYVDVILDLPAMVDWTKGAKQEATR